MDKNIETDKTGRRIFTVDELGCNGLRRDNLGWANYAVGDDFSKVALNEAEANAHLAIAISDLQTATRRVDALRLACRAFDANCTVSDITNKPF